MKSNQQLFADARAALSAGKKILAHQDSGSLFPDGEEGERLSGHKYRLFCGGTVPDKVTLCSSLEALLARDQKTWFDLGVPRDDFDAYELSTELSTWTTSSQKYQYSPMAHPVGGETYVRIVRSPRLRDNPYAGKIL